MRVKNSLSSLRRRALNKDAEHPELIKLIAIQEKLLASQAQLLQRISALVPPAHEERVEVSISLTMSQLYTKYEKEMMASGSWRERTQQASLAAFKMLMDITGDIEAASVGPELAREVKDGFFDYPKRRFIGKSANKTLAELRASTTERIDQRTAKNNLDWGSSFFKWLKSNRYVKDNYFTGLAPKGSGNSKGNRKPFTRSDIRRLFSTELYTSHTFSNDWEYWLPLLGLYTGARLEELCQLQKSDIRQAGGLYFFDIHEDNAEENQTKSASSNRRIPLHSHLIELGFLEYIAGKTGKLFTLKRVNHRLGHYPSKRFGDYKTKLNLGPEKAFHSFRHTMRDELVEAEARSEYIKAILGHEQGDMTHGHYGSGFKPQTLNGAIQSVNFRDELSKVKKWMA